MERSPDPHRSPARGAPEGATLLEHGLVRLVGVIAHDFGDLLRAIGGYGESLAAGFGTDDPRRVDALEIVRAAERASALTGQLLDLSRRQLLPSEALDLGEVIASLEELLSRLLAADVELVVRIAPGCCVKADRGLLEQVVTDLAVNVRDAMPSGGRLELSVGRAGDRVELLVGGSGIGADLPARTFEPFATTGDAGAGRGRGLAAVHGIVTQAGGEISVTFTRGEGTCFRVLLPLVAPAADREFEEVEAAPGTDRVCILLAEDEETIRRLVTEVLTRAGYRVYAAASGDEALALLGQHGASIDLLLTDVVMPGMSGPELARAARLRRPALRVLFTSGYAKEPDEAFEDPGVEFIGKPFSPQALVEKVRDVLDDD